MLPSTMEYLEGKRKREVRLYIGHSMELLTGGSKVHRQAICYSPSHIPVQTHTISYNRSAAFALRHQAALLPKPSSSLLTDQEFLIALA